MEGIFIFNEKKVWLMEKVVLKEVGDDVGGILGKVGEEIGDGIGEMGGYEIDKEIIN